MVVTFGIPQRKWVFKWNCISLKRTEAQRAHDFLWKENIWINIAWNVRKSHGALAFALEFHWFFCFVFLSRKKWKINSRLPLVSRYFFKITVPSNILEVKSAFFIYTNTLCVTTKIFPFTIVKPVINQKAHLKNFLPSNWLTFLQGGISCLKKGSKYLKLFLLNYVGSMSRVVVFFYQ